MNNSLNVCLISLECNMYTMVPFSTYKLKVWMKWVLVMFNGRYNEDNLKLHINVH